MGVFTFDEFHHEGVVQLGIYFRHNFCYIFTNEGIFIIAQKLANIGVTVENGSQIVAYRVEADDGQLLLLDLFLERGYIYVFSVGLKDHVHFLLYL